MKKTFRNVSLLLILSNILLFCSCNQKEQPVSKTDFMLDTVITVTVYSQSDTALLDGAFELCRHYEALFDRTDQNSDIYKINHSGGRAVTVDGETALLIGNALKYCGQSGGKFDITTASLSDLWDFNSDNPTPPDTEEINAALERVDYTAVKIDGCTVTVPDGYAIDLGGIAKGYIADRIAGYFVQNGAENALINLGGNVYAVGDKNGSGYTIGIRSPFDGQSTIGSVNAANTSVVTSGTYERCFEYGGKVYHHILDTSTGMPADTGVVSVSVITACSEQADALSTLCLLLGAEEGLALLEQTEGVEGIIVTADRDILTTTGASFIRS